MPEQPAQSQDSSQDPAGPFSVKSERAGLLWRMLPAATRRKIAPLLSAEELLQLNAAFRSYRKRPPDARRQVELSLRNSTVAQHGSGPLLCFIGLALTAIGLYVYHLQLFPIFPEVRRLELFVALAIGCFAPLSLHMLPAHRIRVLFAPELRTDEALTTLFGFLGLLWMLYYIQSGTSAFNVRPSGAVFAAACIAAVTAPLLEEVFFRELVPGLFGQSPHYVGHLIAVVIFAGIHVPSDAIMFSQYLLAAGFLAAVRLHTGGLLYPYLIHAGANLIHQTLF